MTKEIEFFWEIGSTNSYFAWHLIRPIATRHGAVLQLRTLNLGQIFRRHNYVLMEEPPAKINNRIRDLQRWAVRYDLPFRMPDVFPIKTSRAMRTVLAMRRRGKEFEFVDRLFSAYWERNDAAIADYAGLAPLIAGTGEPPDEVIAEAESPQIRQLQAVETDDALARGVFGAPSFIIDGELFWGKDRMQFIEDALS